jgi:hypothetical protein
MVALKLRTQFDMAFKIRIMEKNIRKIVGRYKERNPLERLKEINIALKKLGCRFNTEKSVTFYRNIVGRR